MVTKKFVVKTGVKTGNIILDASNDRINAASVFASATVSAANLIATTRLTTDELSVANVVSIIKPKTTATYDIGAASAKFKDLYLSGTVNANIANIDTITADIITANSLNIDTVTVNTQVIINSSIDATSTDTGSIITAGGVGIMKDLYVGGAIHLANGLGGTTSKSSINYNDGDDSIDFKFNG